VRCSEQESAIGMFALQVPEQVLSMSFVVLMIGNLKSYHLGAQGTFKAGGHQNYTAGGVTVALGAAIQLGAPQLKTRQRMQRGKPQLYSWGAPQLHSELNVVLTSLQLKRHLRVLCSGG